MAFLSESVLAFRSIRRSVFRTIWASRSDLSASPASLFLAVKGRTKRHRLRSRLKILRNSWTEAGALRSLDAARRIALFTWASAIFAQVAETSRRRFGLIFYPNLTQSLKDTQSKTNFDPREPDAFTFAVFCKCRKILFKNLLEETLAEQFFLVFPALLFMIVV